MDEPGQVAIPLLGLTGAADALTPARFDVLVSEEGRYPIEFAPSGGRRDAERRNPRGHPVERVSARGWRSRRWRRWPAARAATRTTRRPSRRRKPPRGGGSPAHPAASRAAAVRPLSCPPGPGTAARRPGASSTSSASIPTATATRTSCSRPGVDHGAGHLRDRRQAEPAPVPPARPGRLVSAAGPVYEGSHGQRQIEAVRLRVAGRD